MTKKKRSILMAVLTLVLCLATMAGGMYAFFSSRVTLANHLEAGSLEITLTRTHLVTVSQDSVTGQLVKSENPKDIDFSKPADPLNPNAENRNVFDLTDDVRIVPGCSFSADMQVANNSDVTFGYWLEVRFDDKVDMTLAEQLKITVTTVNGTTARMLNESAGLIGKESEPIGILATGESAPFTVTLEFCDLSADVNNGAKGKSFEFDLIVHAVQYVPDTAA